MSTPSAYRVPEFQSAAGDVTCTSQASPCDIVDKETFSAPAAHKVAVPHVTGLAMTVARATCASLNLAVSAPVLR
eukprot:1662115-Karenia_brevis.AAC.1